MAIELKIIITSIVLWLLLHIAAYPSTSFAEWGKNKFNSYTNFLGFLAFVFIVIPIAMAVLCMLWRLN